MKNKNLAQMLRLSLVYVMLFSFIAFSCTEQSEETVIEEVEVVAQNLVEEKEAIELAENFSLISGTENPTNFRQLCPEEMPRKAAKNVKSVTPVKDKNDINALYVINYEEGGFVILSGDEGTEPVLAYSDESSFEFEKLDAGLDEWLYSSKMRVEDVRYSKSNNTSADEFAPVKKQWENLRLIIDDDCDGSGGGGCQDTHTTYGPLLTTTWNQGCGYNSLLATCNSGGSCGRVWTGCVATAMAQVINHWESPAGYNYASMPDTWGNTAVATLMRDAGSSVGMNYGCSGSGANMGNARAAFINSFGYSSAKLSDWGSASLRDRVKANIRWNRPVIFSGGENTGWWIFGQYSNGHAWVCDGYRSSFYCETGTGYLYLHMNWGWGGTNNGYFAFNNWNPGNFTFNYKPKVIYDIVP